MHPILDMKIENEELEILLSKKDNLTKRREDLKKNLNFINIEVQGKKYI